MYTGKTYRKLIQW